MLKLAISSENNLHLSPYSPQSHTYIYIWQHHLNAEALDRLYQSTILNGHLDESLSLFHGKRYTERISVRIMLQQLLGTESTLDYLKTGRPQLNSGIAEISISHTGNIYAVSLSHERHGMDIEQWGDKAFKLADRFLCEEEQTLLHNPSTPLLCSPERNATLLWSAKESIYKYADCPGLSFKDDIRLTHTAGKELKAKLRFTQEELSINFEALPNCILTCCKGTPFA